MGEVYRAKDTKKGIVHRDLKPESLFAPGTAASRSSTSAWPS